MNVTSRRQRAELRLGDVGDRLGDDRADFGRARPPENADPDDRMPVVAVDRAEPVVARGLAFGDGYCQVGIRLRRRVFRRVRLLPALHRLDRCSRDRLIAEIRWMGWRQGVCLVDEQHPGLVRARRSDVVLIAVWPA